MTSLAAKRNMYVYTSHKQESNRALAAIGRGFCISAKILYLLICLFFVPQKLWSQTRLQLWEADSAGRLLQTISLSSRPAALRWLEEWRTAQQALGFAALSVDSVRNEGDSLVQAWIYKGQRYRWKEVVMSDSLALLVRRTGYGTRLFAEGQPLQTALLTQWYQSVLTSLGSNGKPFATLQFTRISIDREELVSGQLSLNTGAAYTWEGIVLQGSLKLSNAFLSRYLDIQKGAPYNEDRFREAAALLKALPYLNLIHPPALELLSGGARLNVNANIRKSNEVNILVGLLPANTTNGGKLLLTGEALLNLKNALGSGETLGLHWTQLLPQSPRLQLDLQQPYLFGSRYGAGLHFELFKKDSSFLTLQFRLGSSMVLGRRQKGSLFLEQYSSNLLSVDTVQIRFLKALPAEADVRSTLLGVGYEWSTLQNASMPREGWEFRATAAAGRRKIRRNTTITALKDNNFEYARLYDTVLQRSYQMRTRLSLARYFPAGVYSTIKTTLQFGWVQSGSYYRNELYQIGGYRLLRGFDDESIFTRQYTVLTAEYQFIVGESSYLYSFADAAVASTPAQNKYGYRKYLGTGLGLAFNTGKGKFNFAYALGLSDESRFNLRQGKIHIGFVSLL